MDGWEKHIPFYQGALQAELKLRNAGITLMGSIGMVEGLVDTIRGIKVPTLASYSNSAYEAAVDSKNRPVENAIYAAGVEAVMDQTTKLAFGKAAPGFGVGLSGIEGGRFAMIYHSQSSMMSLTPTTISRQPQNLGKLCPIGWMNIQLKRTSQWSIYIPDTGRI